MSSQELANLIKSVASNTDAGGIATAQAEAQRLYNAGIKAGVHVGREDLEDNPFEALEWLAGQFLEIVESEAWFAMNSWIHMAKNENASWYQNI